MSSIKLSRRSLILGAAGMAAVHQSAAQVARNRFDVDRFVEDIKNARTETDGRYAVEEILHRTVAQPRAVLASLGERPAGIYPIHRSDNLTILNVVWAPLMVLLPHNHNMWASIGIYSGREDNIIWEQDGSQVTATRAASLAEKDVFGLPADAIHSVTNPIGRLTGAIHIYGGDFFAPGRSEWDAEGLTERPWDLDAVRGEFDKAAARFSAVP